jgi:membrane protein required for colicin V production
MSGFDFLIVAVVLASVVLATAQGFFFEVLSLAGVVAGYVLAAWEYPNVAAWFGPYVKTAWVAELAGFLTIFIAVVVLAGIAGRIIRWAAKEAGLRWFDRLLGAVFGLVRGVLIIAVVVLAMASFTPGSRVLAHSELAPYFLVVARSASWLAPEDLRQRFRHGVKALPAPAPDEHSGKPSAATPARR